MSAVAATNGAGTVAAWARSQPEAPEGPTGEELQRAANVATGGHRETARTALDMIEQSGVSAADGARLLATAGEHFVFASEVLVVLGHGLKHAVELLKDRN